jgi:uncharacterized membrane protein
MKKNYKLINILFILFILFFILFKKKNIEKFSRIQTETTIDCEINLEYCKDEIDDEECKNIFEKYNINYIPYDIKKWCLENKDYIKY